jgi:uncharacterized protein (DUF2237 family)
VVPFDEIAHRNVLGSVLEICSTRPMTGWFRNGCCHNDPSDRGKHLVCVEVTAEFLKFSKGVGNDLSTPRPEFDFPGLKPGDRWCLCASRWKEALEAGKAPRVVLSATHRQMLDWATAEELEANSLQKKS